ncbi:MAG: tetratricopeptide repeat protein [Promethearchaeota archaeon]
MGIPESISFPPQEIIQPSKIKKPNFSHIILWMLYYNDELEWSHFTQEPISMVQSTLSNKLKRLMQKDYIKKISKEIQGRKRKVYTITDNGKNKFFELSKAKEVGKSLNYPPSVITERRNYDHWILWMLYNNNSCKWSDFIEEPLSINQSSLSKTLNSLMDSGSIKKENKEYVITSLGRTEYFNVLKLYDLDRQSILEEESKRIEVITRSTNEFFEKYDINNDDIKFRFLNNVLKLSYLKVDTLIDDREEFNKILLFLSINHPNCYPDYISRDKFCLEYNLNKNTLNFFIEKIVDQDFYDTKFFKLEVFPDREYYFQANEKLERMLRAIIDEKITKYTYLNKLDGDTSEKVPNLDINNIIKEVMNEICINLFHDDLKDSLRKFLPEYIKYLAYKIETEEKLIDSTSKLEGLIWQTISEEFQAYSMLSVRTQAEIDESSYRMEHSIFQTLDVFYFSKLNFMRMTTFKDKFNPINQQFLSEFEDLLNKGKVIKAKKLFEDYYDELDEIESLILSDIISTSYFNFEESIDITNKIIEFFPNEYIGYLFRSITFFLIDEYNKALEIVEAGLDISNDMSLTCQKIQILIKKDELDEALKVADEALSEDPNNIYLLRAKVLIYIGDSNACLKNGDKPLKLIDEAIRLNPKDKELLILKAITLCMWKRYKEAKNVIRGEIEYNIFKKNTRIDTAAFFILVYSYLGRGKYEKALTITKKILILYPNHVTSFLIKSMVHGYNLIYNFNSEDVNIDMFKGTIDKTISHDPLKFNRTKYYGFKSFILHQISAYDDALIALNKAIEINPNEIILYFTKIYNLLTSDRENEALKLIDSTVEKFPHRKVDLYKMKSFVCYKLKDFGEGLKAIDQVLKLDPESKPLINNKALMSAKIKRREEAIMTIEELIHLDPNDGNAYDTYGQIFMEFGEYEEAIKKFEKAIELNPTGWFVLETYRRMKKSYEKLGNFEKAKEFYKKEQLLKEKMLPTERVLFEKSTEK